MILLINAGGKGTRLRPLTDNIPKPMVEVAGKPMLHHLVDWAKKYKFEKIVMMLGYKAQVVVDYFKDGKDFGIPIVHSIESEPLDSGGPIKLAEEYIPKDTPFAYISGDHLCNVNFEQMLKSHRQHNADMTVLIHYSSHPEDSDILNIDDNGKITKFISKHDDHSDAGILSNSGLAIMEPKILTLMDKEKFNFENYIYPKVLQNGWYMHGYHTEEIMMDVGNLKRLEKANNIVKALETRNKAVLIDRDGVICKDEKGFLHKEEDLEFFPGVVESLTKLSETDYKIIIVTNQPGIGRGMYTEEEYKKFEQYMIGKLKEKSNNKIRIDAVYYCPYHPTKGIGEYKKISKCRKPFPGMLLDAQIDYGLDLEKSWMIGDKRSDIKAGQLVQTKTIGVKTGDGLQGGNTENTIKPDYMTDDLKEAIDIILSN